VRGRENTLVDRSKAFVLIALTLFGCVGIQDDNPASGKDASADSPAVQVQMDASNEGGEMSDTRSESEELSDARPDAAADAQPDAEADSGIDGARPLDPCPNPCSSVGSFRCGDSTHLQNCIQVGGCSTWTEPAACPNEQICCASHCLTADIANCYQCGTTCGGVTPVCDKAIKGCGCDTASCQALGKVCDATTHQCVHDPGDVYVDPTADRNEDGTVEHPYRTITAALQAPRAPGVALHVHVARGRYDQAHGETLPLVVRGAFIEGAGVIDTIISGSGAYDARVGQGAINAQVSATMVIGDSTLPSGISNVTIYDNLASPAAAHHAVFCDRGNAPTSSNQAFASNTVLKGVTVGPGYDIGVVATTSTVPSATGCNLQVISSNFRIFDVGLWAVGCENPSGASVGRVPVAIRLGDGTQIGGNRFAGFPVQAGSGVRMHGCVNTFRSSYDTFTHATGGVEILQPMHMNETNHLVFQHDLFNDMFRFGIKVAGGAAFIEDLSDNVFSSIYIYPQDLPGYPPGLGYAAGLLVEGAKDDPGFARVNASNNQFLSNQSGIVFQSEFPIGWAFDASRFNSGNIFHCNGGQSWADPFNIIGGDVVLTTPTLINKTFEFNDNEWDHAPPTTAPPATAADGTDMIFAAGVSVSATGATAVDAMCTRP